MTTRNDELRARGACALLGVPGLALLLACGSSSSSSPPSPPSPPSPDDAGSSTGDAGAGPGGGAASGGQDGGACVASTSMASAAKLVAMGSGHSVDSPIGERAPSGEGED